MKNGTFLLHRGPLHPRRAFADIPKGRVALIGEPIVGESMLIVPEDGGVVQTSSVRNVKRTDNGFLVETANSVYRFTNSRSVSDVAA